MCAFADALVYCTAFAQPVGAPPLLEQLTVEECDVAHVVPLLKLAPSYNMARVSAQALSVLEQQRLLVDKAKPGIPVEESLSKDDIARFHKLNQQLQAGMLMQLVESKRARDLDVLLTMAKLADREYRWGDIPREGSEEFKLYGFLLTTRTLWPEYHQQAPVGTGCSLDFAFIRQAGEPMAKVNSLQIDQAVAWMQAMTVKYKMTKFDESKLTSAEKSMYAKYRREVYEPGTKAERYLKDIESLRRLARASQVIWESSRGDAAIAAGDPNAIGVTIEQRLKSGELDKEMEVAIRFWYAVNEKIPAGIVTEWKEIGKEVEKIRQMDRREQVPRKK